MRIIPENRRMLIFLMVMTIAATVGMQAWQTMINNFAVETARLDASHVGLMQSVKEIPGFLALLVIYVLLVISEHRLCALAVLANGLGLALTGYFPSFGGVLTTTLIMSFGFHYYETVNQSLALQYFDKLQAPLIMSRLRVASAAANIAVGLAIYGLAAFLDYKLMFLTIGAVIVLIGVWGWLQDPSRPDLPRQHKRMILRRRYWLYYALTFMGGARRQIFVVFAIYLLVQKFHYSIQAITLLFVINNAINWFLNPLIGRAINRYGERVLLSVEYACLIVIFLVYAYTDNHLIAGAMYIADHIVFNFVVAIRTYYQKIAAPEDIASGMAVGFTINHIAAVVIPALGGLLWLVDPKIPFICGAGMGLISLVLTQFIRLPRT